MDRSIWIIAGITAAMLVISGAAQPSRAAPNYVEFDIPGGKNTFPLSINGQNNVTGYYGAPGPRGHQTPLPLRSR